MDLVVLSLHRTVLVGAKCFLLDLLYQTNIEMRWIHCLTLALLIVGGCAKEEDDSNEVSVTPSSINLNVNFRKALLKALIELENEDSKESHQDDNSERIVEKASASALSVFTSSEDLSTTSTSPKPTTQKAESTKEPLILFQKSQAVQQPPITTLEKDEVDPFSDAEQILASASSSFTLPNTNSLPEFRSINKEASNLRIIQKTTTTEQNKVVTTSAPPSSTEESEAKAEEVQFFSAPLVAAFTVHQDEQGVPKKVESILRPSLKKTVEENQLQRESKPSKTEKAPQIDPQLEFQQKQKLLEQEIIRLNLNLKQQQLLNQQQQQIFLRQQQEQLRLRSNLQPFLPIINPAFKQFGADQNTEKPVPNQFVQFSQQLPTKQAQKFNTDTTNNNSGVSLISSITYDPIREAGKLPLNGQILPVKGPINFHTPIIQTAGFQQFHSLPQVTPLVNTLTQIPISQPQFLLSDQQPKRTFRQEIGTGNFLNTDFSGGLPSFSIQRSVQPTNPQQVNVFALAQPQPVNRIFRSNLESTLTSPQQVQNQRFFRSNVESTFRSPNSFERPQNSNYQLSNLLYHSGAFGSKAPEDINIISKVLALNHHGGNGNQYFSNGFGKK